MTKNTADRFDEEDFGPLPKKDPSPVSEKDSWPELEQLVKPKKPGFGFGMAILWCLLYVLVMQVIAGVVFGIPIILITLMMKKDQQLGAVANNNALMQDPDMQLALMIILVFSHLTGLLFSWLMLRIINGKSWKRKIALTRLPSFTHMALIFIGFPAMMALSAVMDEVITKVVPSIQDILDKLRIPFQWPGIEQVLELLKSTPYGLGIFAVAVMPAINEEIWCRGFLNHNMAGRYRTWVVVLLTSFLFGCLHLEPRQGIGAMFLGAAIHCAYLATRSLLAAMFVHFANNAIAVTHVNENLNFPLLKPLEVLYEHSPFLMIASASLLFAAVVYALYQTRSKLVMNSDQEVSFWHPIGPASAELPPDHVAMSVRHEPISYLSVALVLGGAIIFAGVVAFA